MSSNSQISLFRMSYQKVNEKIEKDAKDRKSDFKKISTPEEFITYLMSSKKDPYNKFKELKNAPFPKTDGYSIKVFYKLIPLPAKWTNFFIDVVDESEAKFFKDENLHKSFAGFVYSKTELFAFCGGLGSHIVGNYIDDEFGISVLVRLLEKDEVALKRAINKALTGSELSADRFFKTNHKIGNEDSFGKIYKTIYTHLPKEILSNELGLPPKDKERGATAIAKTSFHLGRAISFSELIKMVGKIEEILKTKPLFELNKIKQISGRKIGDKDLLEKLFAQFTLDIFRAIKNNELGKFELFHKDLERYIESTSFDIARGRKRFNQIEGVTNFTPETVFAALGEDTLFSDKTETVNPTDLDISDSDDREVIESLYELLGKYSISSMNADDEIMTQGRLLDYFQGEVELDGATYFYLEESWYKASKGFIEDINDGCRDLISELAVENLLTVPWAHDEDDENTYIEKYLDDEHTTVFPLHRVIYNNTELCDLLIKVDRTVYFVHIKQGFSGSVRDLVSQVYLSAKMFINELKNDKKWDEKDFIDGYFNALKTLEDDSGYGLKMKTKYKTFRKASFVNLFKDVDNFYFVFAVYDKAKTERVLPKEIKQFKSNIAKMSLINLEKDIASISPRSSSLKFVQIRRG